MYYSFNSYRRPGKVGEFGGKRVPDYTELAYKEAVSKLRYFLTGNYSSSVRSYGCSPSIKDLDDLDGGLEKKSSTALLQYRPRPRLSAKYATLYADSLNNYGSGNVTGGGSPAAATSEPAAAGTSPDVITFIQKQEEYIEQLERESQYCREELNNLLGKVKEVISENEHLHEAQKDKIITKMFHTHSHCPTGSETDDLDDAGDSTGRDTDAKLSSKSRRMKPRTRLEGPSIVFESRISELEAQLAQAKIDLKKVQDENNENKRKLVSGLADNTCLDGYKRQIENLQRDKTALENQISKLKSSLIDREDDLRHKRDDVTEHRLRDEIATLEGELRALKEELSNERSRVRELAGEGARRAAQERSAAELRHSAHCDQLAGDLAAQYDHVAKLQLELDRQRREESDLKRELAMRSNAIEDLKMELKNKSGTLQADLAQALAEKASVEEELSSARLSLERQIRQSKHEANRLNSEIQSVRQRLDRADADLVLARRENLRLSEKIASLETELKMKNLTPTSPEKKKEKEMSSLLESIENKHGKALRRGRTDEPIRTQRDRSRSRNQPLSSQRSTRCHSGKESDSSNNYPPIVVGPLTTSQDLNDNKGEKIFNLPLMIQQPFLREKKEPIKVDISVKLIPKPRKKDKRKKCRIDEVVVETPDSKVVRNSLSMEINDGNIDVLKKDVEYIDERTENTAEEAETATEIKTDTAMSDKGQNNDIVKSNTTEAVEVTESTLNIADTNNETIELPETVVENEEQEINNETHDDNEVNNEIDKAENEEALEPETNENNQTETINEQNDENT